MAALYIPDEVPALRKHYMSGYIFRDLIMYVAVGVYFHGFLPFHTDIHQPEVTTFESYHFNKQHCLSSSYHDIVKSRLKTTLYVFFYIDI